MSWLVFILVFIETKITTELIAYCLDITTFPSAVMLVELS